MKFPAIWLTARQLCWDQAQTNDLLTQAGAYHVVGLEPFDYEVGGAVVIPARYYATPGDVAELNDYISRLDWVVAILTSDEESMFPVDGLRHDRMYVWRMTPHADLHKPTHRFLGHGPPPGTREAMGRLTTPRSVPTTDWFFAGQVNHRRRHEAVSALRGLTNGVMITTPGFTQGLDHESYRNLLSMAKVVPCPSGPYTPDSFRVWEALEAGAVPVVDALCPVQAPGYWPHLLGMDPPFPLIEDWSTLPEVLRDNLNHWPANANRIGAWWLAYQRSLHILMQGDIADLSGQEWPMGDITVLIPTSSCPIHPETWMIEETIASVRFYLPNADIMLLCDGVRQDQEHRRADYEEYLRRVMWLCRHQWHNVQPIVFDVHEHQVAMCRFALDSVETPLTLFVEHDTPLTVDTPIDFAACSKTIMDGELNTIRFHYESRIPIEHQHLMIDREPVAVGDIHVIRSRQWSSRPHLSDTEYFRDLLHKYFTPGARSFVEDRIHGVLQDEQWKKHKLGIYAEPDGYLKRSYNLDGRRDDTKAECHF